MEYNIKGNTFKKHEVNYCQENVQWVLSFNAKMKKESIHTFAINLGSLK